MNNIEQHVLGEKEERERERKSLPFVRLAWWADDTAL
jgi:hypothetical protein